MDLNLKKPKVLLLIKKEAGEKIDAWDRLEKALRTVTELEVQSSSSVIETSEIDMEAWDSIFADASAINWSDFSKNKYEKICLVKLDNFLWHSPKSREALLPVLKQHSCLILENRSVADLVRIIHLFISPKRKAGVAPLIPKESVILAEKIQDINSIGSLMDKLVTFFESIEGVDFGTRTQDLRIALQCAIFEGFRQAKLSGDPFPTIDFQASATKEKMVFNLRHPIGEMKIENINSLILDGGNFNWHQMWVSSDSLLGVHHSQSNEIEFFVSILSEKRASQTMFRSFLFKENKTAKAKEDFLQKIPNYNFKILSEVNLAQIKSISNLTSTDSNGIDDLSNLPEEFVEKITSLEEKNLAQEDKILKISSLTKDLQNKVLAANRELSQKRSELLKIKKKFQKEKSDLDEKINTLSEKLDKSLQIEKNQPQQMQEKQIDGTNKELVVKLNNSIKALESEKKQTVDQLATEQKKLQALEQKYSNIFKELSGKEREIQELKATIHKIGKNQSDQAANKAGNAKDESELSKIRTALKETEQRESVFKQELKKLNFKLESADKNAKALQDSFAVKIKLFESKLQEAKTKELELLKKIDDLSNALKKASKAA
ncbi:MAG: hypothetical protein M9962_15560 [Oligoflexia bacterium]|nr:hypothetical protein [Oligoflexia bacterium]